MYCNNVEEQDMEAFPITRSQRKLHESSSEILTPASETIISGNRHTQEQGVSTIVPINDNGTIRWTNVPKQPIPSLDNVGMWIGHQLQYKRMPVKYQHMPPEGELITAIDGYPEGLLGIPNNDGSLRIIVPKSQRKALVMQCHEDMHHQSHVKVLYILKPLFYWPGMTKYIEDICTTCQTCITASVRRKHLKARFDLYAPQSTMLPRHDYGIDFYGVHKGEILVIVDLLTRETILTSLNNRTQDNLAKTILKYIIFQRGGPKVVKNRQRTGTIIPNGSSHRYYVNI